MKEEVVKEIDFPCPVCGRTDKEIEAAKEKHECTFGDWYNENSD